MRRFLWTLALAAIGGTGLWFVDHQGLTLAGFVPPDPEDPSRFTALHVGSVIDVPEPFQGRCLHVVAFDGSCHGCEALRDGREEALWLTERAHPRDLLFPRNRVFVAPSLWDALEIEAIPVEFIVRASGRIAYINSPIGRRAPSCEQMGERDG